MLREIITRWPVRKDVKGPCRLNRVRGHEAAYHDAAAQVHIPDHGLADRITLVANDRALRHLPPQPVDRHPISPGAHIIRGAAAVGDIAAGHAVRANDALEPRADVGGYVLVLPVVEA